MQFHLYAIICGKHPFLIMMSFTFSDDIPATAANQINKCCFSSTCIENCVHPIYENVYYDINLSFGVGICARAYFMLFISL